VIKASGHDQVLLRLVTRTPLVSRGKEFDGQKFLLSTV